MVRGVLTPVCAMAVMTHALPDGCDPQMAPGGRSEATTALFWQLASSWKTQDTTFSGQTDKYWDDLVNMVKKNPAVRGFDMQNYSPHNPWRPDWSSWDDGTVQNAIDWYYSTSGTGIVQFQWHWFSPTGGSPETSTFYSDQTDFDTAMSVVPGTPENEALVRDLDAIASQLARLQDAGVPVLWRPLHEARGNDDGAWFWWGRAGPTVTKQILDVMRDVFLNQHKLDNLIWVWSEPNADWYPGNDVIDIVGFDSYPDAYDHKCNDDIWNELLEMTSCQKMLTLSEVGAIPDIDWCHDNRGIQWLYFMAWADLVAQDNEPDYLSYVFGSNHVKSIEDISARDVMV